MPSPFVYNPLELADSYKDTHHTFIKPGTKNLMSYYSSRRSCSFADFTLFFGLQYLLKAYLEGEFVKRVDVETAKIIANSHFGPHFKYNEEGWRHIITHHGGRLPLTICAVPEGLCVPVGNALMTIHNTCSSCSWLVGWVETLLQHLWYTCNVATKSKAARMLCEEYNKLTADSDASVDFQLHDFGFRGATTVEAAAAGGAAHLINFKGTDTKIAFSFIRQYYGGGLVAPAYSVPASEHSVTSTWGRDGEADFVKYALAQHPQGILSLVADTWDVNNFVDNVIQTPDIKATIMKRKGKVVVRPDSGDPVSVILSIMESLMKGFGFTVNSKGYRVLDPHVGVLWGDGLDYPIIKNIFKALEESKISSENIVLGMGGGLLQKHDRDTQSVAIKGCLANIDGKDVRISKEPKADSGKKSFGGFPILEKKDGKFTTTWGEKYLSNPEGTYLKPVFIDGKVLSTSSFKEIQETAKEYL